MRVGNHQSPATLPPLGGILWRLHKGNLEVKIENLLFFTLSRCHYQLPIEDN